MQPTCKQCLARSSLTLASAHQLAARAPQAGEAVAAGQVATTNCQQRSGLVGQGHGGHVPSICQAAPRPRPAASWGATLGGCACRPCPGAAAVLRRWELCRSCRRSKYPLEELVDAVPGIDHEEGQQRKEEEMPAGSRGASCICEHGHIEAGAGSRVAGPCMGANATLIGPRCVCCCLFAHSNTLSAGV